MLYKKINFETIVQQFYLIEKKLKNLRDLYTSEKTNIKIKAHEEFLDLIYEKLDQYYSDLSCYN